MLYPRSDESKPGLDATLRQANSAEFVFNEIVSVQPESRRRRQLEGPEFAATEKKRHYDREHRKQKRAEEATPERKRVRRNETKSPVRKYWTASHDWLVLTDNFRMHPLISAKLSVRTRITIANILA